MAKVTITIEDRDEGSDENIGVVTDFDPAIDEDAPLTPAQSLSAELLNKMFELTEGEADE